MSCQKELTREEVTENAKTYMQEVLDIYAENPMKREHIKKIVGEYIEELINIGYMGRAEEDLHSTNNSSEEKTS